MQVLRGKILLFSEKNIFTLIMYCINYPDRAFHFTELQMPKAAQVNIAELLHSQGICKAVKKERGNLNSHLCFLS